MENAKVNLLGVNITLTKASKAKMQRYYKAYCMSTHSSLERVYARPSEAKLEAFDNCWRLSTKMNGTWPYVLTYNTHCFTVGFFADHPYTSEHIFVVVTPQKVYYINTEDLD